jgi:hypothetical protein
LDDESVYLDRSVALFGVAELISLLGTGFVIQRQLGISMLSFVLDRGWRIVQSSVSSTPFKSAMVRHAIV